MKHLQKPNGKLGFQDSADHAGEAKEAISGRAFDVNLACPEGGERDGAENRDDTRPCQKPDPRH